MRKLRLAVAVLLPVFTLACEREDAVEDDPLATDPPAVATDPATTPTAPAEAGQMINVALNPVGDANVTGNAMISRTDGGVTVVLELTGAPGAGTHQAHVHRGTCDSPGQVVAPLEAVTTDDAGTGSSTTSLDHQFSQVADGQHIVAAHAAGGQPGPPVTCGEIPQHAM